MEIPAWRKEGVIPIWERKRMGISAPTATGPNSPDTTGIRAENGNIHSERAQITPLQSTTALRYLAAEKIELYGMESDVLKLYIPNPSWEEIIPVAELRKRSTAEIEAWMCKQYAAKGWIAIQSGGSGDNGIDALVIKGDRRMGVQAKGIKEDGKTGGTDVVHTIGGAVLWRCSELHIISTGCFTRAARTVAAKCPIPTRLSNHLQIEEGSIWD